MAVQNVIGDGFRGATWVSLHNGGGVGWGEVINGGFGLVLDGSADARRRLELMLGWDVNNGIARRAWARNEGAEFAIRQAMQRDPRLRVTLAEHAEDALVDDAVSEGVRGRNRRMEQARAAAVSRGRRQRASPVRSCPALDEILGQAIHASSTRASSASSTTWVTTPRSFRRPASATATAPNPSATTAA